MTDRTEALLAELVDLQRKFLAIQEQAAARQEQNIAFVRESAARSRRMMTRVWIMIAILVAMMMVVPVLNLVGRLGR